MREIDKSRCEKGGMTRMGNLQAGTRPKTTVRGFFAPLLTEIFSRQGSVTTLTTDEKERERIRAARIEARNAPDSLRRKAAEIADRAEIAERRARVDRVLVQAGAAAAERMAKSKATTLAKRKADTAESKAERVAKARRQSGQRLLLRALRLIPPDERDEAIAEALRQA